MKKQIVKYRCTWCGDQEALLKNHNCPNIFIHNIINKRNEDEIIIRGKRLTLEWLGENILIKFDKFRKVTTKK